MLIAGHVGLSLGLFAAARRARGSREVVRLGWLAFFALLPDIVDKPVGCLWWELSTRRLFGHSLLFCLLAIVCCRLLWPRLASYAWLVPFHLVLDAMWLSPHTLLFPLLGLQFDPDPMPPHDLASYIRIMIWRMRHQPWMLGGEIAGAVIFVLYYLLVTRRQPRELPEARCGPTSAGP